MEIQQIPSFLTKCLVTFGFIGSLWSCGGDATTTTTTGEGGTDSANTTAKVMDFKTVDFCTIFNIEFPQKWSADFKIHPSNSEEAGLTTIENGFDFEQYLQKQKKASQIGRDYFQMLGALQNVFDGATQEDIISDRNVISQKALTELELKCYRMRFLFSLKDNYADELDAYAQIHRKLNELCNNCTLLTEQQIDYFSKVLKGETCWGVFEKLTTQQMVSFGI